MKPIADSKPFDLFLIQSSEIDKSRQNLQKRAVEPAFDCLYCNFNETFIVVSKRNIRVYNAADGELTMYLCLPEKQPDLTCAMLSKNHRKLFLGDANGRVKIYNSTCFL